MCKFQIQACVPEERYKTKENDPSFGNLIPVPFQITASIKGKGRAVGRALPPPIADIDEDTIIPDSELEFQDLGNATQDESSGDDFVPEEGSQSDVPQDEDSDFSLRVSKATPGDLTRPPYQKAGPSSKKPRGRKSTANVHSEVEPDSSGTEDLFVFDTKAPQRKKAARTKGKSRKNLLAPRRRRGRQSESDESDQESGGLLESSGDDAKPPPRDLEPHETYALIRAAHRKMRKRLGRKLTPVRLGIVHSKSL